jgi:hypothetical protein
MAQLNPSIILSGANPNIIGALDAGQQAGARTNEIRRQNALSSLYQTQGAGIAAGDQSALNALAGFDPMAAIGVQDARQQMQVRQQGMDMLTREEQRQIQAQAATLSAAQRQEEAQRIEQGVAMGLGARSPQEWDAIMSQQAPELVGQFEQREMLANRFMIIADIIKRQDTLAAGPDLPSSVREFQFAQQNPDFAQFQLDRARAGGTQVNVGGEATNIGSIPPGYAAVADPTNPAGFRYEAIPGGPVAAEAEASETRAVNRQAQIARAGGTVIQDLQRALDLLPELGALTRGEGVVGGVSRGLQRNIPGSVVNRITQFTESALSNVGLDVLQQMRENSPTGGALGQVPIQQQQRLEQVLGSLDPTQPPSVLEANIQRVMNIYTDIIYGSEEERQLAMQRGQLTPEENAQIQGFYYQLPFDERGRPSTGVQPVQQPSQQQALPQVGAVVDGYRFLGGDPANPSSWQQVQ